MAVDLPFGWMRQIIDASGRPQAAQRIRGCRGTFWDAKRGCSVSMDLGEVNLRVPFVFRAAPSVEFVDDEPKNFLSWAEEGAAQNAEYPTKEKGNFESGSYVIPGLCAMGCSLQEKNTPGLYLPWEQNLAN